MQFLGLLLAATLVWSPGQDKLGKLETECRKEFGAIRRHFAAGEAGHPFYTLFFLKDDYVIVAEFVNGKAERLLFKKFQSALVAEYIFEGKDVEALDTPELSGEEINALLNYCSSGDQWVEQKEEKDEIVDPEWKKYRRQIYAALNSRWYDKVQKNMDKLETGDVKIKFFVNPSGIVSQVRITELKGRTQASNQLLGELSLLAVKEMGAWKPFTETMKQHFPNGCEDTFCFSIYERQIGQFIKSSREWNRSGAKAILSIIGFEIESAVYEQAVNALNIQSIPEPQGVKKQE